MSRAETEPIVRLAAVGVGTLLVVTLTGAFLATSAPLDPYNDGANGTSRLVEAADGELTGSYATLAQQPTPDRVIIVGGVARATAGDAATLRRYLEDGGQVGLLAEDRRTNQLLAAIGVQSRLGTGYLRSAADKSETRQFRLSASGSEAREFGQVQVNAARPVGVANGSDPSDQAVLAWSTGATQSRAAQEQPGRYPVVTRERVGEGELLLVGDASLLLNNQWQLEHNRELGERLTRGSTVIVYPRPGGFPVGSRLRFQLETPVGVLGGAGAAIGVGVVIARALIGWAQQRAESDTERRRKVTLE